MQPIKQNNCTMKNWSKTFFLFCLFLAFLGKANLIEIPTEFYRVDNDKKIILTNYNVSYFNKSQDDITEIVLDTNYKFSESQTKIEIGKPYHLIEIDTQKEFTLYFTELPIISIDTDFTIVDTPKVLAQFKLIETDKEEISSYIGIEYRGATSQSYPKKSLEIQFWETPDGSSKIDIPLLGMMNDDSFNLQAMYTEDTRIRSKTANELWLEMSSLSYQDKEPEAKNGITSHYVEVFMNGQYYGIYALGEKVNRKNLKLKKYKNAIKGELYKGSDWRGAPIMHEYDPNFDNNSDSWSSFEYKHPKEEINWGNIYDFISFVVDSDQETFLKEINSKFEIENAVDYFIFMNITRAVDNTGKNLYIAKYDEDGKYFYVPWDLDSTFGYNWDGTILNEYTGLLSNGLYDKLLKDHSENSFKNKLAKRWFDLRKRKFSTEHLYNLLQSNNDILSKNNTYSREAIAWDYNYNDEALSYMKEWQKNRIEYLDGIFSSYLSVSTPKNSAIQLNYFPNPVKNELNIHLNKKENMEVQIYTTAGTLVHTEKTFSKENTIDVSKLVNGIYFINCKTDTQNKQFKIIVAK